MSEDTAIIIPVYNEATVVGAVIIKVSEHFRNIICVNDGSKDDSSQIIKESGAVLLEHAINLGTGAARQTGLDYALLDSGVKYFITMDADDQHEIKDAVKMLEFLKKENLDVIFGSRFLGEAQNMSVVKRNFLKLAGFFTKRTTGVYLTDPHIGLRVFNRRFAENLKTTMPDFAYASEIIHRIADGKYKYAEMPVTVSYSNYSKKKGQPMLNAINIAFDLLIDKLVKK